MADHSDQRLTILKSGDLYLVHDGTVGRLANPTTGWQSSRPAPLGSILAHAHTIDPWVEGGDEVPPAVRALADAYAAWPPVPETFD